MESVKSPPTRYVGKASELQKMAKRKMGGISKGYNIKISNGKLSLVTRHCKEQ